MPTISASRLSFLVDDEEKLIGFTSGILQISEYDFFRIAHQNWYNRSISEPQLDYLFRDYLVTDNAPFWVNDFARKVHEKFKAGELDYKEYGIVRRPSDRRTKITGWLIIGFLIVLITVYSYMITDYAAY